jgi:sporulation protein YlmC with PRC-barrel domain
MINVEHIEDWRGKDVVDPEGATLGKLQEVFYDRDTQTPILLAIRHGLLSRKVTMIPVDGAKVGPDYVRVAHDRTTVDAAPAGVLEPPPNAEELDTIGEAYGLRFSDRVSLESATVIEQRRAEARAARERAAELETQARELAADRDAAHAHAEGATQNASQAHRDAERARQAAEEARQEAAKYKDVD